MNVDLLTGISRDRWHKRRKTGGRMAQLRKKRKFELGRPPAMTKVCGTVSWMYLLFSCGLSFWIAYLGILLNCLPELVNCFKQPIVINKQSTMNSAPCHY